MRTPTSLSDFRPLRRVWVALMLVGVTLCPLAPTALAASSGDLLSYESQFICTSCHEPLELVSSPQAQSEKAYLRSLLARGLTDAQIKTAMVAQYGPEVLAKPPARGFNLTVYILPPLLVVAGLALLVYTLPKWRARSKRAAVTPLPSSSPLSSDDAERLDEELDRFI
jgi:cytochrome c-type biogenesis protein CcmH